MLIGYYINVFFALLKRNFYISIEHRANFLMKTIFNLIWVIVQILFVSLIFNRVTNIQGWSKYEIMVIFGIDEIIFPLFMTFSFSSLVNLEGIVANGELDFILLKPLNSKYYLSLYKMDLFQLFPILFGISVLTFSLIKLGVTITFYKILALLLFIFLGFWIFHSLFIVAMSFVFKYRNGSLVKDVIMCFGTCMLYPLDIYKGVLKIIITTIIPLGIIMDFPARMLVKGIGIDKYFYSFFIAIIFHLFSNFLWNRGLKKYIGVGG